MSKRLTTEAPMFPSIIAGEQALKAEHQRSERLRRVAEHRDMMRICWPGWNGDLSVGARIETHSCVNELAADANPHGVPLSKGQGLYSYMSPCKIIEVIDSETFIVEIDYPKQDSSAYVDQVACYNGIKLKLDILDVWVPVRILTSKRKAS